MSSDPTFGSCPLPILDHTHILAHQLVPIPWKESVTVVPRAEYLRKTSYYGNFSRAQGPNAEGILAAQSFHGESNGDG